MRYTYLQGSKKPLEKQHDKRADDAEKAAQDLMREEEAAAAEKLEKQHQAEAKAARKRAKKAAQ